MKKRMNYGRAPGKTQISISLPESLVGRIDILADADSRNRSNYITTALLQIVESAEIPAPVPLETPKRTYRRKAEASDPIQEPPKKSRTRHSTDQIKRILNEVRKGLSPDEVCQKHAICLSSFYRWKRLYA
jgi:hypothetical protein